jgi:hypothetical protein
MRATEQAIWQRRASAELVRILQSHRDLPAIVWTVGSAGAVLIGTVTGPAPAGHIRATFHAWRIALAVAEASEFDMGGGSSSLRAELKRDGVRVLLAATVLDDDGRTW